MAKVITYSPKFPDYHCDAGKQTFFVEKFYNSIGCNFRYKGVSGIPEKMPLYNLTFTILRILNVESSYYQSKEFQSLIIDFYDNLDDKIFVLKNTTIRAGSRFKEGDYFSPRIWSGKPYWSAQIRLAPDQLVEKIYSFEIKNGVILLEGKSIRPSTLDLIAFNDGLSTKQLLSWFKFPKPFKGQIICWGKNINY